MYIIFNYTLHALYELRFILLILFGAYALVRIGYLKLLRRGRLHTTFWHEAGLFLLLLTGLLIYNETVGFSPLRQLPSFERLNLVPFHEIRHVLNARALGYTALNILGNVAMFLPIGLLAPLIWRGFRRFWLVLLLGMLGSILIETLQLFTWRATDIDDVLLNTLGAALGYLLFKLLNAVAPRIADRFLIRR